ncbi:MAG: tRNA (adenosine(37)-N6)-threonylcarbamoyltransferase complex ATPase subunit type 1 TsaE [Anaerolineae bacterium]
MLTEVSVSPIVAPNTLDFISHSEDQTRRLGAKLAPFLNPGDVLALTGDLGSGKTRWVQGVCLGLGVTDVVNSPTFTLVNEYQGRLPVFHIDLYRLGSAEEALSFGLEDYLFNDGISVIEWADQAIDFLPADHLEIQLFYLDETRRRVIIRPQGDRFLTLMNEYKQLVFSG